MWESLFSAAHNGHPAQFVGLENYRALLDDDTFMLSLRNNLLYAAVTIPLAVGLALLMALAVNRRLRGTALDPRRLFHSFAAADGSHCQSVAVFLYPAVRVAESVTGHVFAACRQLAGGSRHLRSIA